MFLTVTVSSVFFGSRILDGEYNSGIAQKGIPQGLSKFPRQKYTHDEVEVVHRSGGAKGTMVLVFALLLCFILFYFTNWQLLSSVWKVG